jgi:hypothetical protein
MSKRPRIIGGTLVALLALAGPVAAGRYDGDVTDALTGKGSSAKITTTPVSAGLKAKVRCKPRLGCPLGKRTKVVLASTGETYRYEGTFTLKGASCRLDAYVYPEGFQGTYNCDGGAAGSIGGSSGGSRPERARRA